MAKNEPKQKTVKFSIRDGVKPTRGPGGVFNLLAPAQLNVRSGTELVLDLGLSCDHALQIFEAKARKEAGLVLEVGVWQTEDAGCALKLAMRNSGRDPILLERGDVLARAVVLDNSDIIVVEE